MRQVLAVLFVIFGIGNVYGQSEIPVDQTVVPVFTPVTQEQTDTPKAETAFDIESFVFRLDQVFTLIEHADANIGEARTALQGLNTPTAEGAENVSGRVALEKKLEATLSNLRETAQGLRESITGSFSDFRLFVDALGSVTFGPDQDTKAYHELKKFYDDASKIVEYLPATSARLVGEIRRLEETQARLSNRFRFQGPVTKVQELIGRLGGLNGNFGRLNDELESGGDAKPNHAEHVGMPTIDNPGTYIF